MSEWIGQKYDASAASIGDALDALIPSCKYCKCENPENERMVEINTIIGPVFDHDCYICDKCVSKQDPNEK